jgi:ligand-binding sensor domain-containing protein
MPRKCLILPLLLAALLAGACGPAVTPTAVPPTAVPPQSTPVPPQSTPMPPEPTSVPSAPTAVPPTRMPTESSGPIRELWSQAGLWYNPIPGYDVAYGYNQIVLAAPDADPAAGPFVVMEGNPLLCAESVPVTLLDTFERARDCLPWIYDIEEAAATEPVEVQVDDRAGYAADIEGTIAGQDVRLHFVALKPAPLRALVLVALAPDGRYAEISGPFEDLVASIDLLTWTAYSNANNVRDVAFFEGYLWTATGGGVVNYALGGGLIPAKYTTADGLPANDVRALVACPVMGETVLVAGTWGGGLAWFDFGLGQWFDMGSAYTEWHGDYVRALACAPERNRLVVGYDDGIDIYDADEAIWTFVANEMGLPGGLQTLLVSPAGETIWAVGRQEAARIVGYKIESFPLSGDYLGQAALDGAGNLWIGTDTGLVELLPDGAWTLYAAEDVVDLAVGPVTGMAVAGDAVWAGSEGQVARFDPQAGAVDLVYTRAQGMGAGMVNRMAVDEEGWIAAGTSTGASVLRDDEWTLYRLEDEPLLDNQITALVQDTAGLIWVGTEGGGVYRFDPRDPAGRWDSFYAELPDPSISTLYADPAGGVWIGHGAGVSYYDGRNWLHLADEAPELDGLYPYALAKDGSGRLWIGSDWGLVLWDGQEASWLIVDNDLPWEQVHALLPDGDGMWVGTPGGLAWVEENTITAFTTENSSLPDDDIHALAIDPLGQLLVAAGPYLAWRDDSGQFLTLFESYYGSDVVAIGVAANGEHWVTTRSEGAYHLVYQGEGADWVYVPAVEGPPANAYTPHSVLVDPDGTVWVGGATGGVARYGR